MSRNEAIAQAQALVDEGAFEEVMAHWVSIPSTAQEPEHYDDLIRYLEEAIVPAVESLGCEWEIHDNPDRLTPFVEDGLASFDGETIAVSDSGVLVVRRIDALRPLMRGGNQERGLPSVLGSIVRF